MESNTPKFKYINNFIQIIHETEHYDPREIVGCTEEEISQLKHPSMSPIPLSIVEFLRFGGHKLVDFYGLAYMHYQFMNASLNRLKETFLSSPDYLNQYFFNSKHQTSFPQDGMIIKAAQDADFDFVKISAGNNPPVYQAKESGTHFVRLNQSFSEYIETIAKFHQTLHSERIEGKETLREYVNQFKVQILDAVTYYEELETKYRPFNIPFKTTTADHLFKMMKIKHQKIIPDIYRIYTGNLSTMIEIKNHLQLGDLIAQLDIPKNEQKQALAFYQKSIKLYNAIIAERKKLF